MFRWIFITAWGLHGLGQSAGVLAAIVPQWSGFKLDHAWILPGDVLVTSWVGKLWALPWAAALVLILASCYGLATHASWWQTAALAGAIASLIAVLPWAATVMGGALIGAAFSAGRRGHGARAVRRAARPPGKVGFA